MAMLADNSASAEDSSHINHGAFSDFSADVDDSSHHDDGIVSDQYLIADDSAWFNACIDVLCIQKRNSRISSFIFNSDCVKIFCMLIQKRLYFFPVAKEDSCPAFYKGIHSLRICQGVKVFSFYIYFDKCFLRSAAYEIDDGLCI